MWSKKGILKFIKNKHCVTLNRRISRNLTTFKAGFTLLELLVASMLMLAAVTTTAGLWRSITLSMHDLTNRSKIAEEIRLVVENISRDFGPAVGVVIFESDRFLLCQDDGETPNGLADWEEPDNIIEYYTSNDQLRRFDQTSGIETVLADGIANFLVEQADDLSVKIIVEFEYEDIIRSIAFTWKMP